MPIASDTGAATRQTAPAERRNRAKPSSATTAVARHSRAATTAFATTSTAGPASDTGTGEIANTK